MKNTTIALLVVSVALFCISLVLPAFRYGSADVRHVDHGWDCLLVGVLPAIFGLLGAFRGETEYLGAISWFANPLLFLAWGCVLTGHARAALGLALAAFALSFVFLSTRAIPMPDSQGMEHITPAIGFFVWVLSAALGAMAALLTPLRDSDGDPRRFRRVR
jgi:hypothetical protein